jgi:hypothetical protein
VTSLVTVGSYRLQFSERSSRFRAFRVPDGSATPVPLRGWLTAERSRLQAARSWSGLYGVNYLCELPAAPHRHSQARRQSRGDEHVTGKTSPETVVAVDVRHDTNLHNLNISYCTSSESVTLSPVGRCSFVVSGPSGAQTSVRGLSLNPGGISASIDLMWAIGGCRAPDSVVISTGG